MVSLRRPASYRKARWLPGNTAATVALEFALVAPTLVLFIMAIIGVSLDGFYQLALDDAVRSAARQVQYGGPASTSGAAFKTAVCSQFRNFSSTCSTSLTYYVQSASSASTFASIPPTTMPSSGALSNTFPAITPASKVVIQVAFPLPFSLPYIGNLITFNKTNSILATTTVLIEPFS